MASIHKQAGRPNWFASFRDATGRQFFKSTGTPSAKLAQKIADGWQKAADLAGAQALTAERARKLIEDTAADVLETVPAVSNETLRAFFQQCADIVSAPNAKRDDLRQFITKAVGEIARTSGTAFPTVTAGDWFKRWLDGKEAESKPRTHERYATCLRRFEAFLGAKAKQPVSALAADDVRRWRDDTAKRLSTASTNMDLKVLRGCLGAAAKNDLCSRNVAGLVPTLKNTGESTRRAFTLEEVRRVLAQCDAAGGEWRGLVLTGLYTGQRLGDVARLTWAQIDFAANEVRFLTSKTGKRLALKMAKPLREHLEGLPSADNPKAYVFPRSGELAEVRTGTISTAFYDEVLAPAGLVKVRGPKYESTGKGRSARRAASELSFHSLRHSLTTWLKAAGASNAMAQAIVGHDSPAVSANYTHLAAEDSADAIGRLPDVTKGGSK